MEKQILKVISEMGSDKINNLIRELEDVGDPDYEQLIQFLKSFV